MGSAARRSAKAYGPRPLRLAEAVTAASTGYLARAAATAGPRVPVTLDEQALRVLLLRLRLGRAGDAARGGHGTRAGAELRLPVARSPADPSPDQFQTCELLGFGVVLQV